MPRKAITAVLGLAAAIVVAAVAILAAERGASGGADVVLQLASVLAPGYVAIAAMYADPSRPLRFT